MIMSWCVCPDTVLKARGAWVYNRTSFIVPLVVVGRIVCATAAVLNEPGNAVDSERDALPQDMLLQYARQIPPRHQIHLKWQVRFLEIGARLGQGQITKRCFAENGQIQVRPGFGHSSGARTKNVYPTAREMLVHDAFGYVSLCFGKLRHRVYPFLAGRWMQASRSSSSSGATSARFSPRSRATNAFSSDVRSSRFMVRLPAGIDKLRRLRTSLSCLS